MKYSKKLLKSASHISIYKAGWLAFVYCILFLPIYLFAISRLIDGDEGYYLLASKLVYQGKIPYEDFFFPQMFLLPYFYGLWLKLFGVDWLVGRTISAILCSMLGIMLYFHITNISKNKKLGFSGILLFLGSTYTLGWFTTTKTYALSGLLVFSSYMILTTGISQRYKYFLCGLFLSLAINTRFYLLVLIAIYIFYIYFFERDNIIRKLKIKFLLLGLAIGLTPNLFFLYSSFNNYLYDNLYYHINRSEFSLTHDIKQKIVTALRLLGVKSNENIYSVQSLLLICSNLYLIILLLRRRKKIPLSVVLTIALIFICFLPSPVYLQYFSIIIPFFIVNIIHLINFYLEKPSILEHNLSKTKYVFILLLVIYLSASFYESSIYYFGNKNIDSIGMKEDDNWAISTIKSVSSVIDQEIPKGEKYAFSWWPGYFVETIVLIFPSSENHFVFKASSSLSEEETKQFRLLSEKDVEEIINLKKVKLIVLGNWLIEPKRSFYKKLLIKNGFRKKEKILDCEIYKYY